MMGALPEATGSRSPVSAEECLAIGEQDAPDVLVVDARVASAVITARRLKRDSNRLMNDL